MALDTTWIKTRVADELGLTEDDLARLYGVDSGSLDSQLASLDRNKNAVYERVLSDVDALRMGYRLIQVNDDQIAATRNMLANYIFHRPVSVPMAAGGIGWRLSSDDAQYVAFRTADIIELDFDWGDVLRLRLNRLILWPDEAEPKIDQTFRDRLADVVFYLVELTGIL